MLGHGNVSPHGREAPVSAPILPLVDQGHVYEAPGLALVTLGIWRTCDGRHCSLITWTSTHQALVPMPSPSSSHLLAPQFAVHPSVWDSGPFGVLTSRARASPREV